MKIRALFSAFALTSLGLACGGPEIQPQLADTDGDEAISGRAGVVFTSSNDPVANQVLVYRRASNGSLQRAGIYDTTGTGTGGGLGSQGALTLSQGGSYLYVVNAGSNELSEFSVYGDSLYLVDVVPTGGQKPVSVTENGGLIYVLHAGDGASGITGFRRGSDGSLTPISRSTRALSAETTAPAQISFSPSGRALVVTEKATNKISEFRVDTRTGRPGDAIVHDSSGQTPFGFAVTARGQIVVSEAFGGAADASKVSSYQLGSSSGLSTISASVPNTESAACWVVLAKNDRFAYVSNTASGSISAYTVAASGELTLVGDGRAFDTGEGSRPTDMAVTSNSRYLYTLDSGTGALSIARIETNGRLSDLGTVTGLPATAVGLAAK